MNLPGRKLLIRISNGRASKPFFTLLLIALITFLAMPVFNDAALGQEDEPENVSAQAGGGNFPYLGAWVGARLQCRKEETGPVKCGTPSPFSIIFRADGTGTCKGEGLPPSFLYEMNGEDKVTIMSMDKSRSWDLFDFKIEDEFISFQAYIYPEEVEGAGENYIHYVFDLARDEENAEAGGAESP